MSIFKWQVARTPLKSHSEISLQLNTLPWKRGPWSSRCCKPAINIPRRTPGKLKYIVSTACCNTDFGCVYGPDVTPQRSRNRYCAESGPVNVARSAVVSREWVEEQCFLCTGSGERCCYFDDPRSFLALVLLPKKKHYLAFGSFFSLFQGGRWTKNNLLVGVHCRCVLP